MADLETIDVECGMDYRNKPVVLLFRGLCDLARQIDLADTFRNDHRPSVVGSYLDPACGKRDALAAAVVHTIRNNATLVIMDHRSIDDDRELVATLVESAVAYTTLIAPERVKRAVAAAYINRPKREATHEASRKADEMALQVAPLITALFMGGMKSRREVAAELDRRGVPSARGGKWHPTTVGAVLRRARAL